MTTDFHYTTVNHFHLYKWVEHPGLFCLSARGIQQKWYIYLLQILLWRWIKSNYTECILCFRSCSFAVFSYSHILTKHWFVLSTFLVSYDISLKDIFFPSGFSLKVISLGISLYQALSIWQIACYWFIPAIGGVSVFRLKKVLLWIKMERWLNTTDIRCLR